MQGEIQKDELSSCWLPFLRFLPFLPILFIFINVQLFYTIHTLN
jgi:hypothetical protein